MTRCEACEQDESSAVYYPGNGIKHLCHPCIMRIGKKIDVDIAELRLTNKNIPAKQETEKLMR